MGRLIPAGTGLARYKSVGIKVDAPDGVDVGAEEEEMFPSSLSPDSAPAETPASEVLLAESQGGSDPLKT